ncbi:hypothetical protein DMN91_011281 [Ooceraea biroi]|uniref:Pilosulin-1 n=1 Tax=Ooceraea biroi TaxID=2015173 RepID=A0A026WYJ7_OOCBI|nr:pilosulin-3a [Ooceraea biroi]EZA60204.1 Pilosulin-1 [Ooceraea biroi]RLU17212.1 hypothetical protein DMN91_011281 [Ooceraea biroi]
MRMSCLPLALLAIFAVLIVHAPQVQAEASAEAEADAEAESWADALADPGWSSFFKAIKNAVAKLFKKLGPTIAAEAVIQGGSAAINAASKEEKK